MPRTIAFLAIGAAVALFVIGFNLNKQSQVSELRVITTTDTISIAGVAVRVVIANTPALREQGLSSVGALAADEGMLFVFEKDDLYSFWMKDMLFPIDMLWLDAEGAVVHLEKNVSPDTYPQSFTPRSPARYVLEVPAGWSDEHDIQIGTRATLD